MEEKFDSGTVPVGKTAADQQRLSGGESGRIFKVDRWGECLAPGPIELCYPPVRWADRTLFSNPKRPGGRDGGGSAHLIMAIPESCVFSSMPSTSIRRIKIRWN